MKIHKLHRHGPYGARTHCGKFVTPVIGSSARLPRLYKVRGGSRFMCVTRKSDIKPTCKMCQSVKR